MKEIIHLVRDCENEKPLREVDRIHNERKCYRDIKAVIEPFMSKDIDRGINVQRQFKRRGMR